MGRGVVPGPGEVWAKTWGHVKSTPGQISLPFPLLFCFSPLLWVLWECVCCQKFPQAEFAVRVNCNMAKERAGWAAVTGVQRKESCSSLSPCASWLAARPDGAGLELAAPGGGGEGLQGPRDPGSLGRLRRVFLVTESQVPGLLGGTGEGRAVEKCRGSW